MKFTDYKVESVKAALKIYNKKSGPYRAAFTENPDLLSYYGRLSVRLAQASVIPIHFLQTAFDRLPGFEEELDRQEILHRDPASIDESLTDPFAEIMRRAQADGDILSAIEKLKKHLDEQFEELKRLAAPKN